MGVQGTPARGVSAVQVARENVAVGCTPKFNHEILIKSMHPFHEPNPAPFMEGVASLGGPYLGQGGIKQSARLVAWGGEWEASILPRLRTARGNVRALSRAALQIHTWTNPQARKVSDPSVCRRGFLYDPARGWGGHTLRISQTVQSRELSPGGGAGTDPQAYPRNLLIAA